MQWGFYGLVGRAAWNPTVGTRPFEFSGGVELLFHIFLGSRYV